MDAKTKSEIAKLTADLASLKAKKKGSTPEARLIRNQLRGFGHFVSGNDTREGKPKKAQINPKPIIKPVSKPTVKAKTKMKPIVTTPGRGE